MLQGTPTMLEGAMLEGTPTPEMHKGTPTPEMHKGTPTPGSPTPGSGRDQE